MHIPTSSVPAVAHAVIPITLAQWPLAPGRVPVIHHVSPKAAHHAIAIVSVNGSAVRCGTHPGSFFRSFRFARSALVSLDAEVSLPAAAPTPASASAITIVPLLSAAVIQSIFSFPRLRRLRFRLPASASPHSAVPARSALPR